MAAVEACRERGDAAIGYGGIRRRISSLPEMLAPVNIAAVRDACPEFVVEDNVVAVMRIRGNSGASYRLPHTFSGCRRGSAPRNARDSLSLFSHTGIL